MTAEEETSLALLAAYERGRSDERARCVAKIKYWFGGDNIFDQGYECVREIEEFQVPGSSDFDGGVREGLQRAIDLLRTHHETMSNQEPFRYLARRKGTSDLLNTAFIERLEEMRDALSDRNLT